jgi:predicted MFS family arabinose efflux permease
MDTRLWRATLSGLCASLIGIGLARFAYTPLIPALIAEGWFAPAEAAYLGAANLAGYLAGALLARRIAGRCGTVATLRAMMALATASFFAAAFPSAFLWFFLWRFASGLAGGALMVLAAPAIVPFVPQARRGMVGGAIFTGVGLGIALSGTLVPLLLGQGLTATWLGLGVLALVLTAIAWSGWPAPAPTVAPTAAPRRHATSVPLVALMIAYGLNAAGLVPHMVFLVDFVARGLGRGIAAGSIDWIIFGIGAVAGPMLAGRLADRIGFSAALAVAFAIQIVFVALPAFADGPIALAASSLVIGAFVPGIVPLVLGRVHELLPDPAARGAAWSAATAAFAIGQATAAYGFSYLFGRGADVYGMLFGLGAGAVLLAFTIDRLARLAAPVARPERTTP